MRKNVLISIYVIAVSYTHLDVYKRQHVQGMAKKLEFLNSTKLILPF